MAESSIGRDWIIVRLERHVHRELRELAALWDNQYAQGRTDVPHDPDKPLSINAVVKELLRRDKAHRTRSKRSSVPKAAADELRIPCEENGKSMGQGES